MQRVEHVKGGVLVDATCSEAAIASCRASTGSSGRRAGPSSASSFGVNTRPIVGSPSSQVIVDAVRTSGGSRRGRARIRRRSAELNQLASSVDEARLAVRRQAHDLEFVAVPREPEYCVIAR